MGTFIIDRIQMTEIRKFNLEELLSKLKEIRKEHMDLRFKKASMQLSDTTQIRKIKKDIARLETRLTELRFLKGENNDSN